MAARAKHHRSARLTILLLLAFVAILMVSALTLNWADRTRNAEETYKIYSAYLSEGILNDAHDWSTGSSIQVIVQDSTRVGVFPWWLYPFDGRLGFNQLQTSTRLSFIVSNLFSARIRAKVHVPDRAKVFLASASEIASVDFKTRFPRNLGYIVFSAIGLNRDQTQATFYVDHFCGLCGGGRYVLMEKVNGSWQVREEHYAWIS